MDWHADYCSILVAPCIPTLPFVLGVLILLVCGGAIIQNVVERVATGDKSAGSFRVLVNMQHFSRRALRFSDQGIPQNALRLTLYIGVGSALIFTGYLSGSARTYLSRSAILRKEENEKQQKLVSGANAVVAELVTQAEAALALQNIPEAEEKIKLAKRTLHASEFGGVQAVSVRIANAKAAILFRESILTLRSGDINKAKAKLAEAIAIPNADTLADARKLEREINDATDPARIRTSLIELPDETFQQLELTGELPSQFVTSYDSLNRQVTAIVQAELAEAKQVREARRLAVIETERKEREKEERAAATAQLQAEAARVQKGLEAAAAARIAEAERQRQLAKARVEARQAEEEIDVRGLVLLRKSLVGNEDEISGIVINRRASKLSYAQITFNLYDESGAQVGSALANVNGLEPGGTWKFKAATFGVEFSRFKFSELSGF